MSDPGRPSGRRGNQEGVRPCCTACSTPNLDRPRLPLGAAIRGLQKRRSPSRWTGFKGASGGLGRNRTTDTRIFKPREWTPTIHMDVHSQGSSLSHRGAAELFAELACALAGNGPHTRLSLRAFARTRFAEPDRTMTTTRWIPVQLGVRPSSAKQPLWGAHVKVRLWPTG